MPDIKLEINGSVFSGWEELSVTKSVEAICGKFELAVSDLAPFPVVPGDTCTLTLEGHNQIVGYVDSVKASVGARNHGISVAGRDKTGDLVDCSAVHETQEFTNIEFKALMEKLAGPFGISVTVIPALDPFPTFALQQETAFEAIERACRLRGVFPNADEKGNLIIAEFGKNKADSSLLLPGNILSADVSFDYTDRFSKYTVYGQQPGGEDLYGEAAAKPDGEATDAKITRYRPLIIVAEGGVSIDKAKQRAQWEAAVRAARSMTFNATVQGWTQTPGGRLWAVNELVSCAAQVLGVYGEMLVKELTFKCSNTGGTTTELALIRPDAYLKQPDLKAEKNGKIGESLDFSEDDAGEEE